MNQNVLSIKNIAKIAILAALSAVLMVFSVPLFFAPSFLEMDLAEVPALIGAFSMGPLSGFIIILLKNLINILIDGSKTFFVGELSNIVVNGTFMVVAAWYYKHHRTFKGAIISMVLGVLAMTLMATLSNYFVMFPLYAKMFGQPMQYFVDMASAVNPLVHDYLGMMLFTVVPFNLVKGTIISIVTTLIYPHISPLLKR